MYNGLKEYVKFLEEKGELRRIPEFVDPVLEIACATDIESKKPGGGKALLFDNTGTAFPVLTNLMGSEARIRYALGVDALDDIGVKIDALIDCVRGEEQGLMGKLKMLSSLNRMASWQPRDHKGHAPCQDVVQYAPQLSQLPVLQSWPQEVGRCLARPLVHTVSPLTGHRHVELCRMQVIDEATTGMHWHMHTHGAKHLRECTHRLPVAVCLGGDPVYSYVAAASLPEDMDPYTLAGVLRGKPVELVKCFTQDLKVPADCDFVIEGYVQKSEDPFLEGPLACPTGFYSQPDLAPKFHITCISHRFDAIYPATVPGIPPTENKYIQEAIGKLCLATVRRAVAPEIEDLYLPEKGAGSGFLLVKIRKDFEGQVFKVAHALWGTRQLMDSKFLLFFDEDVEIRNWNSVCEAICRNVDVARDLLFSRGPLPVCDHAASDKGLGGKLCVDATRKEKTFEGRRLEQVVQVLYDEKERNADRSRKLWLLGANCDPVRDGRVREHFILDAMAKRNGPASGHNWPEPVSQDPALTARLNERLKD